MKLTLPVYVLRVQREHNLVRAQTRIEVEFATGFTGKDFHAIGTGEFIRERAVLGEREGTGHGILAGKGNLDGLGHGEVDFAHHITGKILVLKVYIGLLFQFFEDGGDVATGLDNAYGRRAMVV